MRKINLSTFELLKMTEVGEEWIVLSEEQVKQLQTVVVGIAKDIIEFCEKNELTIFLGGGSALGAVRHHGFIPWDDDMDLNMPRADYEKFIELFPKEYSEKYWLHTPESTHNYGSLMAKVLLKNTVVRKYEDKNSEECGAFIDIFVVENTYDNAVRRKIHGYGCILLSALVSCRRFYRDAKGLIPLFEKQPEVQKVVKMKARLGMIISWLSLDTWVHIANNWNKKCKNSKTKNVVIPTGRKRFFGEIYERDKYCQTMEMNFEQYRWPVSSDVYHYLEMLYGNYMEIPPVEKREKHILLEFRI